MFAIPLAYSNMRFLLTYSVARSHSWDRDGSRFRCCSCNVRTSVVDDTYFPMVLPYVQDCQAESPGDAPCRPER